MNNRNVSVFIHLFLFEPADLHLADDEKRLTYVQKDLEMCVHFSCTLFGMSQTKET